MKKLIEGQFLILFRMPSIDHILIGTLGVLIGINNWIS